MKNFKTYTTLASGLVILMVLLLVPNSESKSRVGTDSLRLLAQVSYNHAQNANQEASRAAENQRKLVKQQELLRSPASESSKRIAGSVTSESGRLTARELAREKAVLQQLEANARRSAEVLESVKRLAAEVERQPRR